MAKNAQISRCAIVDQPMFEHVWLLVSTTYSRCAIVDTSGQKCSNKQVCYSGYKWPNMLEEGLIRIRV